MSYWKSPYTGKQHIIGSRSYFLEGLNHIRDPRGGDVYNPYTDDYVTPGGNEYNRYQLGELYSLARDVAFELSSNGSRVYVRYPIGYSKKMDAEKFFRHVRNNGNKYKIYTLDAIGSSSLLKRSNIVSDASSSMDIFADWKDWSYTDLPSFLSIALERLPDNEITDEEQMFIDSIKVPEETYSQQQDKRAFLLKHWRLYRLFIRHFDNSSKSTAVYEKIFRSQAMINCLDKLWNSLYAKYIDPQWRDSVLPFSEKPYCSYLKLDAFESIWKKYSKTPNIRRILTGGMIGEDQFTELVKAADPTSKGVYYEWILKSITSIADLEVIKDTIRTVLWLKKKGHDIDINKFVNLSELLTRLQDSELQDLLQRRAAKILEHQEIASETDYLYDGKQIRIVSPKTERSSKFYSKGTKWCIGADKGNMFESYNSKGKLFIILVKEPKYVGEKYAIHLETYPSPYSCVNDKNEPLSLSDVISDYPAIAETFKYANMYENIDGVLMYRLLATQQVHRIKEDNISHVILALPDKHGNVDLSDTNVKVLSMKRTSLRVILPKSLETLTMGEEYDQRFTSPLPNSLKTLIIGEGYDQPFTFPLPDSLESLTMGGNYNQPFNFRLPKSLKTLTLGYKYDQPFIFPLPDSLKTLTLGYKYDQPFVFPLPDSLETLIMLGVYNQPFAFPLPKSLKTLTLGYKYDQPFSFPLPDSLKTLTLGFSYNRPFTVPLPDSLESLTLGHKYNQPFTFPLPNSLISLTLGHKYNFTFPLPDSLVSLTLGENYTQPFTFPLPKSLKSLIIHGLYEQPFTFPLPDSLESLTLGYYYNQPFNFRLPNSLKSLIILGVYDQLFTFPLPDSLKTLTLGYSYDQPFIFPLPDSLESLTLGYKYNQPFIFPLPGSLKSLTLGHKYNQPFTFPLPDSLKSLTLGYSYKQPFTFPLPKSLNISTVI